MPSLKSGLRNSSILENVDCRMREGQQHFDDTDTILTEYKRRGSSLPAITSSISVRVLPSLRHSATDPNLWTHNAIPKDVIETDYLSQTNPSSESLHQTADNTFQKESRSTQKLDSKLDADVRRELQKAYLDWLGQRVITRRGPRRHPAEQRSNYNLLVNADLVDRIALDIVRMSEREPSGLSGCRLRTRIERQQSADMDLGCVRVDQDAEETFEIVLSLRECHKSPEKRRPTARLMGNVSSFLSNVFGSHHHHHHHHQQQQQQQQQQNGGRDQRSIEVHVSDAYQLEKIKLKRVYDGRHNATKNVGLCSV